MRRLLPIVPLLLCTCARAEDWPQFLGPRRDGTSKETIAPWSGYPRVGWRVPVGAGHGSPVVAGGLVFLHDKVPDKDVERLTIFTADVGRPLAALERARGPFTSIFGVGPRATPAVAGNVVYTLGVTGRLGAVEFTRRGDTIALRELFGHDLLKEHSARNLTFGVAASPLVEGDRLIAAVGGKGAGVVALDRKTGAVAWKALDDPASYASPIAIGEGAKRQIIVLTQQGLAALAPKDGSVYWQHPYRDLLSESSTTPLRVGDFLIASSVTLGSVALKLTEKNGKPAVEQAWKKDELKCYFSTPVAVGTDYVYMITGALSLQPTVTLRCVEAKTGKTLWSKPNVGRYHAALVKLADDKLLMLDDNGHLTLLAHDPKGYAELARSKVCGPTWAHPAVANGRVYVRDDKELVCLELRAK